MPKKEPFDLTVKPTTQDSILEKRSMHDSNIPPGIFEQRHIGSEYFLVKIGLDADLPSGSTRTKLYFAYDTFKFYAWSKSAEAWKSVTLS